WTRKRSGRSRPWGGAIGGDGLGSSADRAGDGFATGKHAESSIGRSIVHRRRRLAGAHLHSGTGQGTGMDVQGRTILLLGGSGLVGLAVARRLLRHGPRALVITALTREEAEGAIAGLEAEGIVPDGTSLVGEWGDIFLPEAVKDWPRAKVLEDAGARAQLLDDLYGELTPAVVERSTLGALLLRHRPQIVVDCVNTATALAYQNVFESAASLRRRAREGSVDLGAVEGHLATLY